MAVTIVTPHPTTKAAYSWLGVRTLNPQWNGTDLSTQYIPVNLDLSRQEYKDAFIPEVNGDLAIKDWNKTPQHVVDQTKLALVFSRWGSVINLNNGDEKISFAYVSLGDLSGTTYLGGGAYANQNVIFFNDSLPSNPTGFNTYDLSLGTWGGWTAMHEIGHVLGLSHSASPAPLVYDFRNTIMNYPARGTDLKIDPNIKIPLTPGMIDISALQSGLYGFSTASAGTDTYTFTDTSINFTASTATASQGGVLNVVGSPSKYVMTIWDSGGIDTITTATMTTSNYINLNAGQFSSIGSNIKLTPTGAIGSTGYGVDYNVGIAIGASIENATGGSAADRIVGNQLNNVLIGSGGNDTISGGFGNDTYTGGTGADAFVFDLFSPVIVTPFLGTISYISNDLITDYLRSQSDKIDLSIIDANTNLAGNQAFSFIGSQSFGGAFGTGVAGQLHFETGAFSAPTNVLSGDTNGDTIPDFRITLTGITSLLGTDFIL